MRCWVWVGTLGLAKVEGILWQLDSRSAKAERIHLDEVKLTKQ